MAAAFRYLVLDQNMSVLEGSLGILPRRILVAEEHERDARQTAAGCRPRPRIAPRCPLTIATLTDDAILGGRLRLLQPKRGHRFGHDAILLAAAVPARARDHAIELGAGVGAASLALLARVPGCSVTLIEIDPALCGARGAEYRAQRICAGARRAIARMPAARRAPSPRTA